MALAEPLPPPPWWYPAGACRDADTALFFGAGRRTALSAARMLCRSCSVRMECREFAVADKDIYGFWGDTTHDERKAIRAGRRNTDAAA